MTKGKVIVIGGGAAGLMAAGRAAGLGAETLLLERMERPGRKLRITGKGRCNLTNQAALDTFIQHFGKKGRFLRQAFSRFFSHDLVAFFEDKGVATEVERGGRIFPESNQAVRVVDALVQWIGDQGVALRTGVRVQELILDENSVAGVRVMESPPSASNRKRGEIVHASRVILATGGASYPATGSTGDGYTLARSAGHALVPIRPALVPLETAGDRAQRLQGLSLANVKVRLRINGKKRAEAFGEMLFTHFGISGPIILSLSRQVVDALRAGHKVSLSIDLKPALDDAKLEARLLRDFQSNGKQQVRNLLKLLLPRKLIPICMESVGLDPEKAGHHITAQERKKLRLWLKDFSFEITGHRSWDEAIVTAGGVDLREIDPRTMESRLIKGLYFAGEVMDMDGDTGGFNLQAAFSTGWLAGACAAQAEDRA